MHRYRVPKTSTSSDWNRDYDHAIHQQNWVHFTRPWNSPDSHLTFRPGPLNGREWVRTELWLLVALDVKGSSLVDPSSVIPSTCISRVLKNMCSMKSGPAGAWDKITISLWDEVAFKDTSRAYPGARCFEGF